TGPPALGSGCGRRRTVRRSPPGSVAGVDEPEAARVATVENRAATGLRVREEEEGVVEQLELQHRLVDAHRADGEGLAPHDLLAVAGHVGVVGEGGPLVVVLDQLAGGERAV